MADNRNNTEVTFEIKERIGVLSRRYRTRDERSANAPAYDDMAR